MRLWQILAVCRLFLEQVRDRVQPKTVDAEVKPEPNHVHHLARDLGILAVEVGLMCEEPMPVELLAHWVVRPVRLLGVDEDHPGERVPIIRVPPYVVVAVRSVRIAPRLLEPRM